MYQNEKTCRLCLLDVSSVVPIFSTKNVVETSSIQMKIMELANVQVYAGDGLPSSVCETCHKLLDEYHAFKTQIEKSDVILRHQLSTSQTDPLSIDPKLDESVGTHGEFVKAETLVIKDEVIDEEHVERILQPSSHHSPSSHLTDAMVNDDRDDDDDDDDNDNDNDPGGGDMDVDEEEETDPLASDSVEPSALDEANGVVKSVDNPLAVTRAIVSTAQTIPLVTSTSIVANQPTNLLLVATPLILKSSNQAVSTNSATATSFVALPTNVSSTFVTVPTSAIKPPIQAPSATVTSKTVKKKTTKKTTQKDKPAEVKDEPKPSTSTADSTEMGESTASTSGEQPQVMMKTANVIFKIQDNSSKTANNVTDIVSESLLINNEDVINRTCEICHKVFHARKYLKRHKKAVHSSDFEYQSCKICNKVFKTKTFLDAHTKLVHLITRKKYRCVLCGKRFKTTANVRAHFQTRHSTQSAVCEVCGKTFKNVVALQGHMKCIHSGIEKKVCEICGKSFKNLKGHIDIVHGESVASTCDICEKEFRNERLMKYHKSNVHVMKRKFACDICGAQFKLKKTLENHSRTHSDIKNYQCKFCDKLFKYKSALRTHQQRLHYNLQPYNCDKCGESFKWKQTYDKHFAKCTGVDSPDDS